MNNKLYLLQEYNKMKVYTDGFCKLLNEKLEKTFYEIIEEIDNLFNEEISPYIISLYELDSTLDELISKNVKFSEYELSDTAKILQQLHDDELKMRMFIEDAKKIIHLNTDEKYTKKMINDAIKGGIHCSNKTLYTMIKKDVTYNTIQMMTMIRSYFNEQLEFFNNFDDIFKFKDNLFEKYQKLVNNDFNEKIDNANKIDIKRFICTYDNMKCFLVNMGYEKVRQNGTSHAIYKNKSGKSIPLPNKKGEMCPSTVSLILNQCGCDRKDLGSFIKGDVAN